MDTHTEGECLVKTKTEVEVMEFQPKNAKDAGHHQKLGGRNVADPSEERNHAIP